jgi:hypothetical protein
MNAGDWKIKRFLKSLINLGLPYYLMLVKSVIITFTAHKTWIS